MTIELNRTQLREADWERDGSDLRALRAAVFIDEQGVPATIEQDGRDADASHVLAERDGDVIGCGRLLADGRIGRLAVRADCRGAGVGAGLLQGLLELARERAMSEVYLHAQASAEAFYRRAGFEPEGDLFEEAGIAHRNMCCVLDYREHDRPLPGIGWPQPFAQLVVAQARLARREVHILSPTLDAVVFGDPDLCSAITRLLRRAGRRARVRILVQDVRALVAGHHALVELARRLPTGISIRCLPEHPEWDGETLVVRDRDSLLRRPADAASPGSYRPGDRARAEQALARFEALWSSAHESPEMRRMAL
jgi:predicted GNAT family N-acyltransferase